MSEAEVAQARHRMQELFGPPDDEGGEDEEDFDVIDVEATDIAAAAATPEADRDLRVQIAEARALMERSRRLLDKMTAEDREEAIGRHEQIDEALKTGQRQPLQAAMTA